MDRLLNRNLAVDANLQLFLYNGFSIFRRYTRLTFHTGLYLADAYSTRLGADTLGLLTEQWRRVERGERKIRSPQGQVDGKDTARRYLLLSGVCELIFSPAVVTLLDTTIRP